MVGVWVCCSLEILGSSPRMTGRGGFWFARSPTRAFGDDGLIDLDFFYVAGF
jgi:hypothetical protein